ncbi:uncharacterized protein LOC134271110 [Saccostrea cucullata]|uniref:uncharacterized protein LOC134271110 n=1 Tax=Saccostrea cuccullata TaxID=36930 RepID=UPI002ED39E1D
MAQKKMLCFFMFESLLDDTEDEFTYEYSNFLLQTGAVLHHCLKAVSPRVPGYVENVIPLFSTDNFRYHYRISKEMFEEILVNIGAYLTSNHGGGIEGIPPSKQLLVFMCYMSNKVTMREIGHYFDIGQSTVHGVLKRVNSAFNENLSKIIQWPDFIEQQRIAQDFQLQSGLPDIIGALDGTHIRLSSCIGGDNDYINRKHFPSIQLQVVVDNDLMLRDIYTGWPGSTHDARVLRNSSLFTNATAGQYFDVNKYIIADSAYPLKAWLITPFKDNGRLNINQRRFNRVLSSARQVVERAIGHLKQRFRRLQEITIHDSDEIVKTIVSGCILHNLCILHHDSVEDFLTNDPNDGNGHPNNYPNLYPDGRDGVQKRNQLVQGLP